jgi:hypothetical protein
MIGRFIIAFACMAMLGLSAAAIVGGARQIETAGRPVLMMLGARGNRAVVCTGTAIARDLLLTAAHCAASGTELRVIVAFGAPAWPVAEVARHPRYDPRENERGRVSADVALIKLAAPLPDLISPMALALEGESVAAGDRLLIAGFGVTAPVGQILDGSARAATLVVTGRPGNLQIRLVDPRTRGERSGLGACTGDSGGPVFREIGGRLHVLGVISWSTGPAESEGCGGMTGVTPLTLYRPWIVEQAKKWGAAVR